MTAQTRTRRFSQRTIRQVRLDATRALIRHRFCPDRSEVLQLRCVEQRDEVDTSFGSQLWFFEGVAVDELDRRCPVFGSIEYSIQYGLHDLIEDGVFESESQRSRLSQQYLGVTPTPLLRHPAHRLLIVGVAMVAMAYLAFLAFKVAS